MDHGTAFQEDILPMVFTKYLVKTNRAIIAKDVPELMQLWKSSLSFGTQGLIARTMINKSVNLIATTLVNDIVTEFLFTPWTGGVLPYQMAFWDEVIKTGSGSYSGEPIKHDSRVYQPGTRDYSTNHLNFQELVAVYRFHNVVSLVLRRDFEELLSLATGPAKFGYAPLLAFFIHFLYGNASLFFKGGRVQISQSNIGRLLYIYLRNLISIEDTSDEKLAVVSKILKAYSGGYFVIVGLSTQINKYDDKEVALLFARVLGSKEKEQLSKLLKPELKAQF